MVYNSWTMQPNILLRLSSVPHKCWGCIDTFLGFPRIFDVKLCLSGPVISSPPGPSGGPSKTHLLPGGGVPRVHRALSPVPPRFPRFATPRSVHQFAAVAVGA